MNTSEKLSHRSELVTESGCQIWTAAANSDGYGHLVVDGKLQKAHRVAWELANGRIPAGLQVLHRCDVPACIRVDHLFLGTVSDNMRDMLRKGRSPRHKGDANGMRRWGHLYRGKNNPNYRHGGYVK